MSHEIFQQFKPLSKGVRVKFLINNKIPTLHPMCSQLKILRFGNEPFEIAFKAVVIKQPWRPRGGDFGGRGIMT